MKKFIITGILFCSMGIYLLAENKVLPADNDPIAAGEKVYIKYCLTCHQKNGGGVPDMTPPLRKSPYVNDDPKKLINIVLHGLKNGVEIDGETYSNPMPAFGSVLKDQEIADVLTYLRNSFGNKATPVHIKQVKKIRSQNK